MISQLLSGIQNESLSLKAKEAASEYLENAEKIRSLEKRQNDLLYQIKSLFDQQYNYRNHNS